MQKIKTYKGWLNLSDEEKDYEYQSWDVYSGEGENILNEVVIQFREELKNNKDVLKISGDLYHGGFWVISILMKKGIKIKIPEAYQGFQIIKVVSKSR